MAVVRIDSDPYHPPHGILTHLRQEKNAVVGFMAVLFALWIATMLGLALSRRFTLSDYLTLVAMLSVLLAPGGHLVRNPNWLDTPFELLWK